MNIQPGSGAVAKVCTEAKQCSKREHRRRVFIVGFRDGLGIPENLEPPTPTHRPRILNDEAQSIDDKRPYYLHVENVLKNIPEGHT